MSRPTTPEAMEDETREARIARQAAEAAQRTEDDFIFAESRLSALRKLVNSIPEPAPARSMTKAELEEGKRLDEKHRRLSTDGARSDCRMVPLDEPCPPGCNCARQLAIVERDEAAASWSEKDAELYRLAFREAPKDFERISLIVRRSPKDCQAFYYATKASGLYKQVCDVRYWSDLWDAADAAAAARRDSGGEHHLPGEDGNVSGNGSGSEDEDDEENSDDSETDPRSLEHRNARTSGGPVVVANGWTGSFAGGGYTGGGFAAGGGFGAGSGSASSAGNFFRAGPAGGSAFTGAAGGGGGGGGYSGGMNGGFPVDLAGFSAANGGSLGEIMAPGSFGSEMAATGGSGGGSSCGGSGGGSGGGGGGGSGGARGRTSGSGGARGRTSGGGGDRAPNKRLRAESLSHSLQMGSGAGAAGAGAASTAVGKRHKHSDWLSVNDTPTKQLQHTKHAGGGGGDTPVPVPPAPRVIPSMPSPEAQRKLLQNLSLASAIFGDDGNDGGRCGGGGGCANGPGSSERGGGYSCGGINTVTGGASSGYSPQRERKTEPQKQRSGWDAVVNSGELSLPPLSPHRDALPMGYRARRHGGGSGGGGDDDSSSVGGFGLNGSNDFYRNDSGGASALTPLDLGEGPCGGIIADDDGWSHSYGSLVMADLGGDFAGGGSIGGGGERSGRSAVDPDVGGVAIAAGNVGGGDAGCGASDHVVVPPEPPGTPPRSTTASVVDDEEVDGLWVAA